MKKYLFSILLIVAICITLCACQPTESPDDDVKSNVDNTLLNGFECNADIYRITPQDVSPTDEYLVSVNTDKQYVKAGEGSLKYVYVNGSSHTFAQMLARSAIDFDVQTLSSVVLQVYNASDKTQKLTLSATTQTGAALFSNQQSLEPNVWTEVRLDRLAEVSYKKKVNIAGFSFRFDVDGSATFYVDEFRVELGAKDVLPANFDDVVADIAQIAPQSSLTIDTFDEYVKFIDLVEYADMLYADLADKSSHANSYAKLTEYFALTGGFSAAYTPRSEDDIVTKWEYGTGLTVSQDENETYGGIWSIIVDAKSAGEQSFKFENIDVSDCGELVMWIYNPTELTLNLAIHGGWNSWMAYSTKLAPKDWTEVRFNASVVEKDTEGSFFPIISGEYVNGTRSPFEGTFLFTAVYGVPAKEAATDVINTIDKLPSADNVTTDDRSLLENVRAAYENLSTAARAAVTNYAKLVAVENKLAQVEAEAFDAKILSVISVTPTEDNAIDCYLAMVDLTNEYNALADLTYEKVSKWSDAEYYRKTVEVYAESVTQKLIGSLPEAKDVELKHISQIDLAKTLYDGLTEQAQANVDGTKLAELVKQAQNYLLLFDFSVETSDKISTTTDFAVDWTGKTTYATDSVYGNVMVCNIIAGMTGYPREAEFRIRATDKKVWLYEEICFYVYAPIENATFRVYSENWRSYIDIPLTKGEWTLISIDSSFPTTNNMDGMFFIFIAPEGSTPAGEWKVSSPYAYFDEEKTNGYVSAFEDAMANVPSEDDVTANDKQAIAQARSLYDQMPNYCKNYISSRLVKQLTDAENKLDVVLAADKINAFNSMYSALGEQSNGQDIFDCLVAYVNLGKFQSEVDSAVLENLQKYMIAQKASVAAAAENAIDEFVARCDLPKDVDECKTLYDDVLANVPDDVYGLISSDKRKQLATLYQTAKGCKAVATEWQLADTIANETYGDVYKATLTDANLFFAKLTKGTVGKAKKAAFYVYCPENSNVNLFCQIDGLWTTPYNINITSGGWTKIEFDGSLLENTDHDLYLYAKLNESGVTLQGVLITEIYVY